MSDEPAVVDALFRLSVQNHGLLVAPRALAMTVLDRPNQHPYCVTWAVLTACSNIAISALVISVGEFAV